MTTYCRPLNDGILLTERIAQTNPSSILLIFFHGLGDVLMFMNPLAKLKETYSNIKIDLGVLQGLTFEPLVKDSITLISDKPHENPVMKKYDLVCIIDFPMSEPRKDITKGEFCCEKELGISLISNYPTLEKRDKKICGVHFQSTCLPDHLSIPRDKAERVWNDIIQAGWIPLEVDFIHKFHNPVNAKYDFITATTRQCRAEVTSLIGLIQSCGAFVGGVSGPFHVACSVLPPERVALLERGFSSECFSHLPIRNIDILRYNGEVHRWLTSL